MNDIERCISEWVDRVNERDATIAALTKERDEARRDVNTLNQLLRDKGFGQGEIDGMAVDLEDLTRLRELVGALCPGEGCTFTVSSERDEDDLYSVYVDINGHGYGSCAEFYSKQEALAYAAIRTYRATLEAGKEGQP